jgi:hypothetical protein
MGYFLFLKLLQKKAIIFSQLKEMANGEVSIFFSSLL